MTTGVDLTDASSVKLRIKDEGGTVATVDGTVQSPATGGIIEWTEPEGTWDASGYWTIESVANFSGAVRYGAPALVKVLEDLNG